MRLGQAIELSLDAYPGERFRGEIIALNPRLDEVGRLRWSRARWGWLRGFAGDVDGCFRPILLKK